MIDFFSLILDDEPFNKVKNLLLEKDIENEKIIIKRSLFLDEMNDFLEIEPVEEIFNVELY
jgi:hypothetical protein